MRFTLVGLDPFYWRPPRLMGGTRFSAEDCDPLRQTTYVPSTAFAYPIGKSRVGGPRQQWRHFTHRYIWDNLWDERTEYENTNRQNQTKTSIGSRTDLFESSRIAGPLTLECLRPPKKGFHSNIIVSFVVVIYTGMRIESTFSFLSTFPPLLVYVSACLRSNQVAVCFFSLHFSTIKTKTVADVFCLWRIYSTP